MIRYCVRLYLYACLFFKIFGLLTRCVKKAKVVLPTCSCTFCQARHPKRRSLSDETVLRYLTQPQKACQHRFVFIGQKPTAQTFRCLDCSSVMEIPKVDSTMTPIG